MRFEDTKASECRWSEYAAELLDGWDVVACEAYVDYQGSAQLIAFKGDSVCALEWSYGSCSGCDAWEDEPAEKVREDMKRCGMWFDSVEHFRVWTETLGETSQWAGMCKQALEIITKPQ